MRVSTLSSVAVIVACAGLESSVFGQVFADGFESNAVGVTPSGWSTVFSGSSLSVVASPVRNGSRAFRQQAAPFGAAESFYATGIPSGSWTFNGSFRVDGASTTLDSGDVLARIETGTQQITVALYRPLHSTGAWRLNFNGQDLGTGVADHWYDFRVAYRADANLCDLYLDGVLRASNSVPAPHSATPGVTVHTGAIDNGNLIGYFDDLRVDSLVCSADAGLVAYLPFDGSPNDLGPSHYPVASNGGPTFVQGRTGGAIQFDGVNDYLVMLHNGLPVDLDTDSFTVSFWTMIDPNQDQFYFMQERWPDNLSAITAGGCMTCNTHQFGAVWYESGPGHFGAYAQTTGLQSLAGAWHHLTYVYENTYPTSGNFKLYVDGTLAAIAARLPNPFTPPPPGLVIGAGMNSAVGNFFKGKLDELRIYNRALSDVEVGGLATAPAIVRGPVDVTSWNGRPASFSVYATGSSLSYQWRRNCVPLNDGMQFEGCTSPVLLIKDPTILLSGSYDVIVSNALTQVVSPMAVFTAGCSRADVGAQGGIAQPDGALDNNDFVVYIDEFFAGCN